MADDFEQALWKTTGKIRAQIVVACIRRFVDLNLGEFQAPDKSNLWN